jgi:hypothetical protein
MRRGLTTSVYGRWWENVGRKGSDGEIKGGVLIGRKEMAGVEKGHVR